MPKKNNFKTFYAISIAWQLGFFIAVPIIGFLFLGILADKFFGTRAIFLFLGLFLGTIITVYQVHRLLIPLIKNKKEND